MLRYSGTVELPPKQPTISPISDRTRIVASGNIELNGTSYSCPTSMRKWMQSNLFEFDTETAHISNILFVAKSKRSQDRRMRFTFTCERCLLRAVATLNLKSSPVRTDAEYRLANNTLLFETDSTASRAHREDLGLSLDSNLTHVIATFQCKLSIAATLCCV